MLALVKLAKSVKQQKIWENEFKLNKIKSSYFMSQTNPIMEASNHSLKLESISFTIKAYNSKNKF